MKDLKKMNGMIEAIDMTDKISMVEMKEILNTLDKEKTFEMGLILRIKEKNGITNFDSFGSLPKLIERALAIRTIYILFKLFLPKSLFCCF